MIKPALAGDIIIGAIFMSPLRGQAVCSFDTHSLRCGLVLFRQLRWLVEIAGRYWCQFQSSEAPGFWMQSSDIAVLLVTM
jgi:hypothetical protein